MVVPLIDTHSSGLFFDQISHDYCFEVHKWNEKHKWREKNSMFPKVKGKWWKIGAYCREFKRGLYICVSVGLRWQSWMVNSDRQERVAMSTWFPWGGEEEMPDQICPWTLILGCRSEPLGWMVDWGGWVGGGVGGRVGEGQRERRQVSSGFCTYRTFVHSALVTWGLPMLPVF